MRTGALLVATLVVAGCGSAMWASVPVSGSDASVKALAGSWEGTFDGNGSGAKGVVRFDLAPGSHYAEGRFVFNADDPARAISVPMKQVDTGADGQIAGVIGPYMEPRLKVQVHTQFAGLRQGNTIAGTFTTRAVDSSNHRQSGRWQMTKKP